MKSYVKIRNFDEECYPYAELLDGTKIQMFDVEYESLGTCEITGLTQTGVRNEGKQSNRNVKGL